MVSNESYDRMQDSLLSRQIRAEREVNWSMTESYRTIASRINML